MNEDRILCQYNDYLAKKAWYWLMKYHFTHYADIWDDALQCARLGFLRYLRRNNIKRAEDVFKDGMTPHWDIHNALCKGIIMEACAPCGIHRTNRNTHLRFESVSHDAISNDLHFSVWAEDDAMDELTVDECLHRLTEQERRIVLMLLDGVRPGEVAKRLNMPLSTYQYRIVGIRKKLRAE